MRHLQTVLCLSVGTLYYLHAAHPPDAQPTTACPHLYILSLTLRYRIKTCFLTAKEIAKFRLASGLSNCLDHRLGRGQSRCHKNVSISSFERCFVTSLAALRHSNLTAQTRRNGSLGAVPVPSVPLSRLHISTFSTFDNLFDLRFAQIS
jgi:hypothetical protein